jgi:hypothetical protein
MARLTSIALLESVLEMPLMNLSPELLDQLFALEHQRGYIATLQQRGGFTRRRAECFVRLWGYLVLKQQAERQDQIPPILSHLHPPEGFVACTHREAADLFYRNQERGSDRAAGMMIDRFISLGLMEKRFDGQTLSLQICSIPELSSSPEATPHWEKVEVELFTDEFNPRTDAVPIANLFTKAYAELIRDSASTSYKIARTLRLWSQEYPQCLRVLRRADNQNPVGGYVLYPTADESVIHFFEAPSKSFYFASDTPEDPFKMASPGDPKCTSVNIRSWVIDPNYVSRATLCKFLGDTQITLNRMQVDFPELCDLYSVVVHPMHEELRKLLGFSLIRQDNQRSYAWIYLAVDRFTQLNIPEALATLKIEQKHH